MLGAKACTSLGLVMPLESLELDLRSVAVSGNDAWYDAIRPLAQALADRRCILSRASGGYLPSKSKGHQGLLDQLESFL